MSARAERFRGRPARRVDLRGLVLFVLPVPLFFGALGHIGGGDGVAAFGDLAAFAMLTAGAWLNREGQRAAEAFEARTLARPPLPRKIAAAGLAGLGVATAALTGWGIDALSALLIGAIATGSHLLAFGVDPLRPKGLASHGAEAYRAAGALEQAEARIAAIRATAAGLRDREIERRIDAMLGSLGTILSRIESDPRDLPRARRYLSVYLTGAEQATAKYADTRRRLDDPALRRDYLELLDDLDRNFARGREALLQDDRDELEVEIEVLRERIAADAPVRA